MSMSLAITINALADVALLGGLAYVMSHATRLTPHVAVAHVQAKPAAERHRISGRGLRPAASSRQPTRTSYALSLPS
jgi:hypothetical protein